MSGIRTRLVGGGPQVEGVPERVDPAVKARLLMYLLAAVGGCILASTAIPSAPLDDAREAAILTAIAFAAALGLFIGFDRLPAWGYHALLLCGTALVTWAVRADGEGGSPYALLYIWLAIYAAVFFTRAGTLLQVAVMAAAYGGVLIDLRETHEDLALRWALMTSGLSLAAALIQGLNTRIDRMMGRVQEGSRTDPFTGLYNDAEFRELLDNELERARRSGSRLAIVLLELDGFAVGPSPTADQVRTLRAVGAILQSGPRQIDIAARLEGGRFAALLPYTDEQGAQILAERLRRALAEAGTPASFGVSSFPRHGAGAEPVVRAAESSLGEARDAGGDRVIVFHPPRASIRDRSASVTFDNPENAR